MQKIVTSNIQANGLQSSTIKLDEKFIGTSVEEFYAYFTKNSATLTCLSTIEGNRHFGPISADVMNDLVEAWRTFRIVCKAVDQTEEARQLSVSVEIANICEDYPEIVIEHKEGNDYPYWTVNVSKLDYHDRNIRTIDALLEEVQKLVKRIDQGRAEWKAIKEILTTHPEMYLEPRRENDQTVAWYVQASFNSLGWVMMVRYARNVTELLEEVQNAQIEVVTVKESYRIAQENGLTITKTGSGWTISTSEAESGLQTRTHKVGDLIRTVCEIVNHTSSQAPEPAQTSEEIDAARGLVPLFSHDEMSLLAEVQGHLDAE